MGVFSEDDLEAARRAGVLSEESYLKLKGFLAGRVGTVALATARAVDSDDEKPRFDVTHVLWYAGALIVMTAMGMFSTTAFAAMGGGALAVTGAIYGLAFLVLGNHLWRKGLHTPGGLAVAVAVSMVPLVIYGIQDAFNLWGSQVDPGKYRDFFEYIRGGWVFMELGTIIAALIALRFWPFPFIVFVAAFALWFMSMDLAIWFVGDRWGEYATRREVSLVFGIVMILIAWFVDLRHWRGGDFAFWLHVFGVMCFWGGLTLHGSDNNLAKAIYCLINIGLVFLGVFLGRRVYAVLGPPGPHSLSGGVSPGASSNTPPFSPFPLSYTGGATGWARSFAPRRRGGRPRRGGGPPPAGTAVRRRVHGPNPPLPFGGAGGGRRGRKRGGGRGSPRGENPKSLLRRGRPRPAGGREKERQVSNWRESCMISPRRHHAVTDHPARHDLSLPAAGRLWRAPDDAPSTRLPRSKSDRGEPRDQPGAEEPALRSGRIRQSCGDRAVFGSLKRAVLREHRAPRAFALGRRRPRSRGRRKDLSGRL